MSIGDLNDDFTENSECGWAPWAGTDLANNSESESCGTKGYKVFITTLDIRSEVLSGQIRFDEKRFEAARLLDFR